MIGITKHQILITINSCIDQAKTHYTKPSRNKIQDLLSQHHEKDVGIRWITRCIKYLVDNGFLSRQVRYVHYDAGQILQLPSLFAFKFKGANYLFKNQVLGATELLKSIIAFMKKDDNRWPAKEFTDRDAYRKLWAADQQRLKRLRRI